METEGATAPKGATPAGWHGIPFLLQATPSHRGTGTATDGMEGVTGGAAASREVTPAEGRMEERTAGMAERMEGRPAERTAADGTDGTEVPHSADRLARPCAVFPTHFVQPSSSSTG